MTIGYRDRIQKVSFPMELGWISVPGMDTTSQTTRATGSDLSSQNNNIKTSLARQSRWQERKCVRVAKEGGDHGYPHQCSSEGNTKEQVRRFESMFVSYFGQPGPHARNTWTHRTVLGRATWEQSASTAWSTGSRDEISRWTSRQHDLGQHVT